MDKLKARAEALETVLKGGVAIEGDDEEAEKNARIVYDWLVRQKEETEMLLASLGVAA
jgi:hypothetical protein